jgi:hypothetical protein
MIRGYDEELNPIPRRLPRCGKNWNKEKRFCHENIHNRNVNVFASLSTVLGLRERDIESSMSMMRWRSSQQAGCIASADKKVRRRRSEGQFVIEERMLLKVNHTRQT